MIHAPRGLQKMSIFTTAARNHLSSSVVVFIKVLDINDNVPRLARDYQPYICEGTQAGEVCILWCTDVHDSLYRSNGNEIFHEVDSKSSHIAAQCIIPREKDSQGAIWLLCSAEPYTSITLSGSQWDSECLSEKAAYDNTGFLENLLSECDPCVAYFLRNVSLYPSAHSDTQCCWSWRPRGGTPLLLLYGPREAHQSKLHDQRQSRLSLISNDGRSIQTI